jgi:hypothetical protein
VGGIIGGRRRSSPEEGSKDGRVRRRREKARVTSTKREAEKSKVRQFVWLGEETMDG